MQFYMDNASAIKIAHNQSKTHLRKHNDVRHYHLVHHVRAASINLQHTSRKTIRADILTKYIAPAYFRTASADLIR